MGSPEVSATIPLRDFFKPSKRQSYLRAGECQVSITYIMMNSLDDTP